MQRMAAGLGLEIDPDTITYFMGRETLLTTGNSKMAHWRKTMFIFMSRNALTAPAYFGIPSGQAVELGIQLEI